MVKSNNIKDDIKSEINNIEYVMDVVSIGDNDLNHHVWSQDDVMFPFIVSYANILYNKKYNKKYLEIKFLKMKDTLCHFFIDELEKTNNSSSNINEKFKKCLEISIKFLMNGNIEIIPIRCMSKLDSINEGSIISNSSIEEIIKITIIELEAFRNNRNKEKVSRKKRINIDDLKPPQNIDELKSVEILESIDELTRLYPKDIFNKLKEYISGNESTLKMLSNAAYLHENSIDNDDFQHKTNPLIIGDSGCGKTYTIQSLSKIIDTPYLSISAKTITETGWSGANIEDIIVNFFKLHKNQIEIINNEIYLKSIIFIDEVDKIKQNYDHKNRDINGEGVQDILLSYIENGSIHYDKGLYVQNKEYNQINTSKCLFLFAGAFSGIDDIVARRLKVKDKKDVKALYRNINVNDLIEYGFKKEFAARISVTSIMPPLNKQNLIDILKNKKNSIAEYYKRVMKRQGVNIVYKDCFYKEVANITIETGINARGFKSIFYNLFSELIYDYFDNKENKIILDKEFVRLNSNNNKHLKVL